MKQREYRILELLTERKRIEVAALAREIGVSQVTVRKDLDALEEKGVIHREHGWAVLCSPDDLNGRIAYHYEAKRRIAARAAELVRDGETVMIESGSCCALLADALTGAGRDVTIITNSAFIAGYVRRKPGAKVILLGGVYQNDAGDGGAACAAVRGKLLRRPAVHRHRRLREPQRLHQQRHLRAQAVRDMACAGGGGGRADGEQQVRAPRRGAAPARGEGADGDHRRRHPARSAP